MDPLTFFFTLLIASLGIVCGSLVAIPSKSELKEGEKHFMLLQKIVLSAMIFFFLVLLAFDLAYYNLICLIFAVIISVLLMKYFPYTGNPALFALFGIIFYFSSTNTEAFFIQSALIFLYGFPAGSLLFEKDFLRVAKNLLIRMLSFAAVASALYLLFYLI